jgi:MFS family permease
MPPSGPRRRQALALICAASFMVILDSSIVTVALPSIGRSLHLPPGGVQWVLTAYVVVFGGLLLLGGRAADLFGRELSSWPCIALFTASSLLCGLAWSGGVLVGARVVQGGSAALMDPSALAILLALFPEGAERHRAIGWAGAAAATGGSAGALIGGPLTQWFGWNAIFFLNVPVGLAVLALTPLLVPPRASDREGTPGRSGRRGYGHPSP